MRTVLRMLPIDKDAEVIAHVKISARVHQFTSVIRDTDDL